MPDKSRLYAVGMLAARSARAIAPEAAANDVIDMTPLLRPWRAGLYLPGDVIVYGGKPYRCVQEHNSADSPAWNPEAARSLWAAYHATDAAHALDWVQPAGAHDAYMLGEYVRWKGGIRRCIMDGTVHDPDTLAQNWEQS